MRFKRLLIPFLAGITLILTSTALVACGGSGNEGSETYGDVLHGLKRAELSGETYDAIHQAEDLKVPEKHVVQAFCEFANEVVVGREAWKLPQHLYVVNRIRGTAYELGNAYSAPIRAAMGKLDAVVDLSALNREKLKRYSKACNH